MLIKDNKQICKDIIQGVVDKYRFEVPTPENYKKVEDELIEGLNQVGIDGVVVDSIDVDSDGFKITISDKEQMYEVRIESEEIA